MIIIQDLVVFVLY